ncbi:MAG TPA: hypothetical protein VFR97_04160 [Capillimicrobium sp.]|nr:hypothetical protein [Capillimicrobium sp.]
MHRSICALGTLAALSLVVPWAAAPPAEAKLPRGWPHRFEIGVSDQPGGAAALRRQAPFGFRYQYLAGGVNTGSGWATWNPNGTFVSNYVRESRRAGIVPVFTYYQLLQSAPAAGSAENEKDLNNLRNRATMRAYWKDYRLFLRRARGRKLVVAHVEPDLWGYLEHAKAAKLARRYARKAVRLRNRTARNVKLAWHLSIWGTGEDPTYSEPPVRHMKALARESARWFTRSGGRRFDLVFVDVEDRDAGFNEVINGDPRSAWDALDFRRNTTYLRAFHRRTHRPIVIWQIPVGNSTLPNEWGAFRDTRVEWWLGSRRHLERERDAGVVALLFGGGADGTTTPQTDGGLLFRLTRQYYATGALRLR